MKVPKGTSGYQASWILDKDEDNEEDLEEDEDDMLDDIGEKDEPESESEGMFSSFVSN